MMNTYIYKHENERVSFSAESQDAANQLFELQYPGDTPEGLFTCEVHEGVDAIDALNNMPLEIIEQICGPNSTSEIEILLKHGRIIGTVAFLKEVHA